MHTCNFNYNSTPPCENTWLLSSTIANATANLNGLQIDKDKMYIIPPRNLSLLSLTPILHSTKVTTPPGTPTTVTAALAPSTTTSLCSCFQDTAANNQGTNSVYFHDEASAAACQLEKENVHLTDLMPFLPTRYSHQVHNDSQEVASGKSDRISVRTTPGTKLPDQSAAELATPLSSPQALSGNLTTCPSIELIFARGTNESPGLGRIGTALFIELQRFFPDMTAYGVFYSAPTYKGRFLSGDNLESGAIDVVDRVSMWEEQKEVGLCPETRIVLGGFSLGRILKMHHCYKCYIGLISCNKMSDRGCSNAKG